MYLPNYKTEETFLYRTSVLHPQQNSLDWSPATGFLAIGLPVLSITILITCLGFIKRAAQYLFGQKPKPTMQSLRKSVVSTTDSTLETLSSLKFQGFRDHFQRISSDSYIKLSEEFENLKLKDPLPCIAADDPVNRLKNRFVNILPFDHTRVSLKPTEEIEGSDYINANYISGFNSSQEYIATQGPLKSTVDDFWRMCWESKSKAIVMLTKCIDKDREKCHRYWPIGSMVEQYGDIEVEVLRETTKSFKTHEWIISDICIKRTDERESRTIKHFQFLTWPDFGAVDPVEALIHFVRTIREFVPSPRNLQDNTADKKVIPIIIHCSAGVGRSGTLIAVDIAMQQIKHLNTVDIHGIVHSMRRERVWMVQTEQQYICIYKCVLFLLDEMEAPVTSSTLGTDEIVDVDEDTARL